MILDTLSRLFGKFNISNIDTLIDRYKNYNLEQSIAIMRTDGIKDAEIEATLVRQGYNSATVQQTMATSSLSAATNTLTVAQRALTTAMNAFIGMGIGVAIGLAIQAIFELINREKELAQQTSNATQELKSQQNSIDSYVSKYEDLHTALLEAQGDEKRTYELKQDLLELQKQLNEEFGDAYGKINLVADAYNNASNAISNLNRKAAENYLNENYEGLENARERMTEENSYILGNDIFEGSDVGSRVIDIAKEFEDQGIDIDKNGSGYVTISLNADARNAEKVINNFMTRINDELEEFSQNPILQNILSLSSGSLNEINEIENTYGESYDKGRNAEIITSSVLSRERNTLQSAVDSYNEAILNSEDVYADEAVAKARETIERIKEELYNDSEWSGYLDIIDNIVEQADTRLYDFVQDISNGKYQIDSGQFEGLDENDIFASEDSGDELGKVLTSVMEEYDLSIEEVVDGLKELGYIQEQITAEENTFKPKSIIEITSELDNMAEKWSVVNDLYQDFKDEDFNSFDASALQEFAETFEELANVDTSDFISVLSDPMSTVEEVQDAFDQLAAEFVYSSNILDGLTDETADYVAKELELRGVTNANTVVMNHLTAAKEYATYAGKDLSEATSEEILEFINEADASDIARTALARYYLAKYEANNLTVATSGDVKNIMNLVEACGKGVAALTAFYNAKKGIEETQRAVNNLMSNPLNIGLAQDPKSYVGQQLTEYFDQINDYNEDLNDVLNAAQQEIDDAMNFGYSYAGDVDTNLNKAGGSKKEEEPKEPQVFDWMPEQIENLNEEIEKLEANMESVAGFKLKNKYVDDIIADLEKEIGLYDQMTAKYQERLDSIGLAQEYINKIQSGTMQIEDIADTEDNQALIQQIEDYQKWYDELENCNSSVIEIKQRIEELRFQKLDNIIDEFDTLESSISDCVNTQEELMSLMEQTGEEISFEDYEKLAERQTELAKLNAQYYDELKEEMDRLNIQEGSEEWEKYNSQLEEFKQNIISCGQAVEDYKDEIFELTFKELDDFNSKLDEVNNTISTMRDLIGDAGLVTEEGLTDRGLVQVALYAQELANAQKQSAEYVEAMEALDEALDSGLITQEEYNEALSEYRSGQESAVQAAKQAQAAIIQIVKDGIQAQIDAKTEEINATKEQLDAEKELNDYRESITDKSNQIAVLQKQIATLSLSTDRRDLAQRLELQEKLADLQKEMYNEQADHALEEQQDALDEELENYTEAKESEMEELDTNLDKQTEAINEYLEQVKTNYNTVYAILNEYGDAYSLSAIEDLTAPWDSGKDAADLCSEAIGNVCAEINYEIENIDASPIYDLINAFKELIDLEYGAFDGFGTGGVSNRYEDVTDQGKWQQNDTGWWYGNSDDDYVANGIYTINGKQYGFNKDGYMKTGWHEIDGTWYYFEPENGQMVKSTWRKSKDGGDYYLTADGTMATNAAVKDKDDDNTYYYVDGSGRWDGFELSKDQVEELKYDIAYRKGTKNARPGIALTDEEGLGSEVVITKYGALRQLDSGDSVFNAEQVKNLHALSSVNGLPDKIASLARNLTKNVMYNNNGLNITSPLIQIDGTGLSSAEVASLISAQVDDLPTRIMKAIKYNLR